MFKNKTFEIKVLGHDEAAAMPLNSVRAAEAQGNNYCVARTEKGFYVLNDACPHNGFSLSKGWCSEDNAVVCPLHRYRFNLETGRSVNGIADYVRTWPCELKPEGLFIFKKRWVLDF